MVVRTYFDKNNTIVSNQIVNTGQNPVAELFYGDPTDQRYSRFIFQFNLDRLNEFVDDGLLPNVNNFKHTLRMTNTGAFDTNTLGKEFKGMDRSSSFDLVLYALEQPFDEGVGYDYYKTPTIGELSISTTPSNWYEAMVNQSWETLGAVPSGANIIASQHFEHGNENLEMDITDYVNSCISGSPNYGLVLAYHPDLEATIMNNGQYVGFFTRHSMTFYEPHVESVYNDVIKDDRYNFYLGKDNRLYLYVNLGGNPTNLDELPNVVVLDDEENEIFNGTAIQASKGVYYIDLNIEDSGENACTMFTDIWSNLIINGRMVNDVELDFSVKNEGYFNVGSNPNNERKEYMFSTSGIKYGETIKRGDIRKIIANAKIAYTTNQNGYVDNVEYRLYVKEGKGEYTVIDFQPMNIANNQNYFLLDTNSLPPNTYYLDVRYHYDYEVKTTSEVLKFEIINQTDYRKSQ